MDGRKEGNRAQSPGRLARVVAELAIKRMQERLRHDNSQRVVQPWKREKPTRKRLEP